MCVWWTKNENRLVAITSIAKIKTLILAFDQIALSSDFKILCTVVDEAGINDLGGPNSKEWW